MTSYKLVLAILVSLLIPKVVTAVNGIVVSALASIVTSAFGSMLFNFFYCNLGSNYITEPYRKYYRGFLNRLGI